MNIINGTMAASYYAVNFAIPGFCTLGILSNFLSCGSTEIEPLSQEVEEELAEFLKKENVGRHVHYNEETNVGIAMGGGSPCIPTSKLGITMIPGFRELDRAAFSFVFKHEFSHVKFHDVLVASVVGGLLTTPGAVFQFFEKYANIGMVSELVGTVAFLVFRQYQECKADDFSIARCNVEELKGGVCFLMAVRKLLIQRRSKSCFVWLSLWRNGDELIPICHPSLSSRLFKIIKNLNQRGVTVLTKDERLKRDIPNGENISLLSMESNQTLDLDSDEFQERVEKMRVLIEGNYDKVKRICCLFSLCIP